MFLLINRTGKGIRAERGAAWLFLELFLFEGRLFALRH